MSSMVNKEVVKKFKNARKILSEDSGTQIEADVREDEEQSAKLQEIIDILVAAGYFRARIKGLSSFDKVIGGMVWCIESCNVELDVDLLFKENLSIGQKISLTEKIVAVLPKLKCPYTIEPHQIQGLDFIHIFPVIQWLVKRSLECRQEVASFVRACAVDQFNKKFDIVDKNQKKHASLIENLNLVSEKYRPHRFYRRKNAGPVDPKAQLQITLLEYGHSDSNYQENLSVDKQVPEEVNELNEDYRRNLDRHYTTLQLELKDGGQQSKDQAIIESLEEKKQIFTEKCEEYAEQQATLEKNIEACKGVLETLRTKQQTADAELQSLKEDEKEDELKIKEIEDLIILNDDLKAQESQFKEHCKKELERLTKLIEETKLAKTTTPKDLSDDKTEEINAKQEKIRAMRMKLAKINRELALVQRQIDDIPNRTELAQYQKRFVELNNQVAIKLKETKQYYSLYNTLNETRFWMKKELSLLNSISESYPEALVSVQSKEEFLQQFQNIVDSVRFSKVRAEQKLDKEKQTRDFLSNNLHILVEQQRRYVAAVKQLGMECRKQEMLLNS